MKPYRIFVSSVQKEFQSVRKELCNYIQNDPLFRDFFEVFLFENVPAKDKKAEDLYIVEVDQSDIYLGLFYKKFPTKLINFLKSYENIFKKNYGNNLENAYKNRPELRQQIESWKDCENEIVRRLFEAISLKAKNTNQGFKQTYPVEQFNDIQGDLTIFGLSPYNDNHIFEID